MAGDGTLWLVKLMRSGEINVRKTDDGGSCDIIGLETSNSNLILIDHKNRKVKLFSPDGRFLSSLPISGKPIDVAVVDMSTSAVSVNNRQIIILDLT